MTCRFCERAKREPDLGQHADDCRGCAVRRASQAPRHIRQQVVDDIREREGAQAAEQFTLDVVEEFNRRQTVRRAGRAMGESR